MMMLQILSSTDFRHILVHVFSLGFIRNTKAFPLGFVKLTAIFCLGFIRNDNNFLRISKKMSIFAPD